MDMNTIIGIVAVVVIAVLLVLWGIWSDRSRKRALERAEQEAKRRADEKIAAKRKAEAAKSASGSTTAETAATSERPKDETGETKQASAVADDKSADRTQPKAATETGTAVETAAEPETAPAAPAAETEPVAETESAALAPAAPQYDVPEKPLSRIQRLKAKLSKSSNPFGKALFAILTRDNLTEADWEDVEDTLLLADVGAEASEQLVDDLRKDARITGKADPAEVRASLKEKLLDLVGRDTDRRLNVDKPGANKPSVIIMVGVNGTGKTTTAGKLARLFVADGKKVVMGAADTFRAAAADQLETWGARVNVPVVRSDKDGADPASVAFEASKTAKEADADVLIIDTAGRLQNKANLMDELGKIRRVTEKNLPVDEVLLVLDATTGQNGMTQAKVFAEAIGITGVVLSKLDGSAKGGIVISVQKELGVPVKLVGLGEGPDDLAPFDPEGFVDGILA
ncbi:signal recognition particle-docking protein FtsY [Bifidobacterium leontopitheci]|uniref:Signal recognition particle receptor FtsY n=1 Tax=Bifidobacterium leontopitheci TaxID=2650774 RepID=A0A6I1GLC2_9BIFI|nr:signal recognition particle-docking protein FtsY [Bifidobacterium leontopitheci]KAB7790209.1 signal recognition particle-docking protein FtsY [Bifidobacterium leontopitheci]